MSETALSLAIEARSRVLHARYDHAMSTLDRLVAVLSEGSSAGSSGTLDTVHEPIVKIDPTAPGQGYPKPPNR